MLSFNNNNNNNNIIFIWYMDNYNLYGINDDQYYHLKKKYLIIYSLSVLIAFLSGGLIHSNYTDNILIKCNCTNI